MTEPSVVLKSLLPNGKIIISLKCHCLLVLHIPNIGFILIRSPASDVQSVISATDFYIIEYLR
jgi:hypothetical protein